MKIVKIENNSGKWFDLKTEVGVKTNEGVKKSNKIYFNGFEPTYKIRFNDGVENKFTGNHKLMLSDNTWSRVDELSVGQKFNNGLTLEKIELGDVEPTMDMEVPDVHYYILSNGVISHNTSFICGQTSPGIEPIRGNVLVKVLAGIQVVVKNKHLKSKLQELGKDTQEVWESITNNIGSVQHLDFLDKGTKAIFKTASEISPKDIIDLASDRQKYIDMSQSLNLFDRPNYTLKDIYDIHMYAFNKDIKTLYYYYSQAHSAFENVNGESWRTCESCED